MKTYVINTHPLKQFPSIAKELKKNGSSALLFHFGVDVELKGVALIDNEVGDWYRFRTRKQPSSFTGLCPSENSSGPNQRLGSIDRRGNKRIRKQRWRTSDSKRVK